MKFSSLFPRALLSLVMLAMLASCQAAPAVPTATALPTAPVATAVPPTQAPAATPTAGIIKASDKPIKIGEFDISIAYNGYMDVGYNPSGAKNTMALVFKVTEANNKLDQMIALHALITDIQGKWIEGSVAESGKDGQGNRYLVYYIYTSDATGKYYLTFPSGEMIELPR